MTGMHAAPRGPLDRMREHPRRWMALRLLVGLGAAVVCALLGPRILELAHARPGFIPVGMAGLLGGLLHPRVRHWFIVSLCFTVALLAMRDALKQVDLPPLLDYSVIHAVYPMVWSLVVVTAAAAGVLEALHPGGVAARRCYFATAFLYLTGHGLTKYLWEPTWESLVILDTGIVAGIAVAFADRLDFNPEKTVSPDEAVFEQDQRRKAKIAANEWLETPEEPRADQSPNRS